MFVSFGSKLQYTVACKRKLHVVVAAVDNLTLYGALERLPKELLLVCMKEVVAKDPVSVILSAIKAANLEIHCYTVLAFGVTRDFL